MTEAAPPPPILGIARHWWLVATLTPSLLLMGLNATILDIPQVVIVPQIAHGDHYHYQWATGASTVGSVIGFALLRWLRDRFGLKQVYMAGLLLFTAACVPCGAAPSLYEFVPARFVQGLGQGIVVTNVLAMIWREFPQRKDLAMALYAIAIYFGKAIAPTLGGFLTDYPDWRWIFYINAPVALVTFILSWWVLLPDKPTDVIPQPFDFLGMGLLIAWVVALMVCLLRGQKWGWTTSPSWVVMATLFGLSFTTWLLREIWAQAPLIDLSLFRERTFTLAVLCKSIFMITFGAVISLLANYMVVLRGYPRTTTGLVFLPGALTMGVFLLLSGLIGMRWSRKVRLVLGMAALAFSTWQLTVLDLYTDKFWIGFYFVCWGASAGLVLPPLIVLPMEGLTQPQVVSSASIKNMVRELPSTIGALLVGILLTRRGDAHFDLMRQSIQPNRAVVEDVNLALADHLAQHGSSGMQLHQQADLVIGAYIQANARAFAGETALHYLALLCVIGVGLALLIRPAKTA